MTFELPPLDLTQEVYVHTRFHFFRYPPDLSALQSLFDSLHLTERGDWHREELGCIMVDDFQEYISPSPLAKVAS